MVLAIDAILAAILFYALNWIGRHASGLGYLQLSVFLARDEAPAFNFLLRIAAPIVFILIVSTALYLGGLAWLVQDIWRVTLLSYIFRIVYNCALGRAQLINWVAFSIQALLGTLGAYVVYQHLILPRTPLFPDLTTIGNELWIGIVVFIYAILNSVNTSSNATVRRKNNYQRRKYNEFRAQYADVIEGKCVDRKLELIAYAILIHEDFNRPPLVRAFERLLFPRFAKTLGVMQVTSAMRISDIESVRLGMFRLNELFTEAQDELKDKPQVRDYLIIGRTISKYNKDESYVYAVSEILQNLWARIAPQYREDFEVVVK